MAGAVRRTGGRSTGRKLTVGLWRLLLVVLVIAGGVALGSFGHFTYVVRSSVPPAIAAPLPGAVVLTGGGGRVNAGVMLLAENKARRLLISGVNPRTSEAAIRRTVTGIADRERLAGLFTCCVQLGREALDTLGNAREARDWATARGIDRLVVVTSDYHMPRALLEMRRALPGATLTPWPVATPLLRATDWYGDPAAWRRLFGEWARLVSTRAADWLGSDVVKRLRS